MNTTNRKPIIKMDNIVKSFHGVRALNGMSLDLYEGEIHCLVGENGAGKSTLMKVLSGAYLPDSGTIYIDNQEYDHMTAARAQAAGLSIIYQENLLVPWMNVVENIFVGREEVSGGFLNSKKEYERAQELCDSLGISLNLNTLICDLSVADQQFVKIIKAINNNPKILIMDEPTSMFNVKDVDKVLTLVRRIAASGVSVIYISHFLKEVQQIADRITVIRDGSSIRTYDNADRNVNLNAVVSDMVGRDASLFYTKEQCEIGEKAFEVVGLKVTPDAEPISFHVNKGEILGVAGMVGSGRTEMANAIVGAAKKYGGKIYYNGKELHISNPRDSIRHRIAYITEDRQRLGLNLHATIVDNLTEVGLQTKVKSPFVSVKKFVPLCKGIIEGLRIKMASPMQEVRTLSGGNQQKVVLGKWLFTDSDIFIFDEPTRGIDVNAKAELYKIMTNLVKEGKVIIMISSDMPEIISVSDRVMILAKGRVVKTLEKEEISEQSIIKYALEVNEDEQAS